MENLENDKNEVKEVTNKSKRGRPRKYKTDDEAYEAKLRKDKGYYEKKNPNVEHGKIGRKAVKTLDEILLKERMRNGVKGEGRGVKVTLDERRARDNERVKRWYKNKRTKDDVKKLEEEGKLDVI
jgi:hypothetical protein